MVVTGMKCTSCGKDLVRNHIARDDGIQVGVSQYPNVCGKIKSLTCCGYDMVYEIN